jgi:RNA polymerase sigma factor (sigma-70 family)
VYRTAERITGNAEDAEDVLQTLFLRLLGRELSGDVLANPRAYLYRATVNIALDVLRARKRRPVSDDSAEMLEAPGARTATRGEEDVLARIQGEICLLGGTVMVLGFQTRSSIKDVDAVFAPVQPGPAIRATLFGGEPRSIPRT